RKIARERRGVPGRLTEYAGCSLRRRPHAVIPVAQRGLAGVVRAEDADELAFADAGAEPGEDGPPAAGEREILELDRTHGCLPERPVSSAANSDSIQSWYFLPSGSVSVTPTTGTPDSLATERIFSVNSSEV